jgi:PAS domain S-box-containing protein
MSAHLRELERFRSALDHADDAIMLVSRESMCFIDANATACKLLGYTHAELLALGPAELCSIPATTLARVYDAIIESGSAGMTESALLCKDGSELQAEMQRHAVRDGESGGWIIVFLLRDISARKQAEIDMHRQTQMLLDEAARQAAIIDALPAHIVLLDARGDIVSFNASWRLSRHAHAFGIPAEGMGLNYATVCDAVCDEGAAQARQAAAGIRAVLEGAAPAFAMEYSCLSPTNEHWFLMQVAPLQTTQPGGAVVMHIDFTAERQAKQEILRLNASLEQRVSDRTADLEQARSDADSANRAKSTFLATMSHEIRTPMNGVIGMIDVLQQSGLQDTQQEMVELIRESAFSLLAVIEDILDFSKIEAERLEIEVAPLALADLAGKVCRMLEPLAAEQGVQLTLMVDPEIPASLLGDAARLRQVLVNLVSNAIKFSGSTTRNGRVWVRAKLAPRQHGAPRMLELNVTDNGVGMDQETQARLFNAFTQGDASTTRRFGGTGLGLVISRRLVELMGGSLGCSSDVGRGAEFTVRLPLMLAPGVAAALSGLASEVSDGSEAAGPPSHAPAKPSPSSSRAEAERAGRLILVAEDNPINQRVILMQLALLGFAADVAADGKLALERWSSGHYALLLCDLHMPTMDGYELVGAIRATETDGRRMPILALTANTLKGEADRCRAAGMDDYLIKPLQLADLKKVLERWLPPPAALVDVDILEGMVGNDPAVINEFLQAFSASLSHLGALLTTAQRDQAPARVAGYAHQLKSSARSVGAMALGEVCERMETAGNAGDSMTLALLLPAFEREAAAVTLFLRLRMPAAG